MTNNTDHFQQIRGNTWYGGSFAFLRFSTFLKIVESTRCDGRILLDWEENIKDEPEYGLASVIFSGGKFTNAFFKTSYLQTDQLSNIPALEALLCRVWGIGFDYQIQGNYGFECNREISGIYTPDFSLDSNAINEIVTELQEIYVIS